MAEMGGGGWPTLKPGARNSVPFSHIGVRAQVFVPSHAAFPGTSTRNRTGSGELGLDLEPIRDAPSQVTA